MATRGKCSLTLVFRNGGKNDLAIAESSLLDADTVWSPGQLDNELQQASWVLAPFGADLIFSTTPERMWDDVIQRLGSDPAHLLGTPGVH